MDVKAGGIVISKIQNKTESPQPPEGQKKVEKKKKLKKPDCWLS